MTPIDFDVKLDLNRSSTVNYSVAAAIHMMSPLSLQKSRSVRAKLKKKVRMLYSAQRKISEN